MLTTLAERSGGGAVGRGKTNRFGAKLLGLAYLGQTVALGRLTATILSAGYGLAAGGYIGYWALALACTCCAVGVGLIVVPYPAPLPKSIVALAILAIVASLPFLVDLVLPSESVPHGRANIGQVFFGIDVVGLVAVLSLDRNGRRFASKEPVATKSSEGGS
jgi:hypothetical protein